MFVLDRLRDYDSLQNSAKLLGVEFPFQSELRVYDKGSIAKSGAEIEWNRFFGAGGVWGSESLGEWKAVIEYESQAGNTWDR